MDSRSGGILIPGGSRRENDPDDVVMGESSIGLDIARFLASSPAFQPRSFDLTDAMEFTPSDYLVDSPVMQQGVQAQRIPPQ